MKNGETSISVHSDYYEKWDDDNQWEECSYCYGTGLDRDEIYDCLQCGGDGEVRIEVPQVLTEISLEQPLTETSLVR